MMHNEDSSTGKGSPHGIAPPDESVHVLLNVLVAGSETTGEGVDNDERRIDPSSHHIVD
jgi:hypothetical protein